MPPLRPEFPGFGEPPRRFPQSRAFRVIPRLFDNRPGCGGELPIYHFYITWDYWEGTPAAPWATWHAMRKGAWWHAVWVEEAIHVISAHNSRCTKVDSG